MIEKRLVFQSHFRYDCHDHFSDTAMRTVAGPDLLAPSVIDRRSRVPLHRQVYDALRRAILDGTLRPGARVPSTRTLAADLGVSRFPVLSAYDQLLHEGYLEGRVGSGTYVRAAPVDGGAHAKARPVHGGAPRMWRGAGGLRPFRASLPALDEFPRALWARLAARAARALTPDEMAYGDPCGLAPLRQSIAEHLRMTRGVRCEADQVLIVSGSQPALRLCAAVLLRHRDRVALEEPGYPGARAAFEAHGAEMVAVPVDADGLDVTALAGAGSRIRAVYVTPSHQYPLGDSMSAARRLELIAWAQQHDAWILEDDYDSEFRYVSRPLGAVQGMDDTGHVIYVGTFSKSIFPALRIGFLVAPYALWDAFVAARDALDVFPPTIAQRTLAAFLAEGHYARHLRRMRAIYRARRDALVDGLRRECSGALSIHNADAGLHISTHLAEGLDDTALVARLAERGLIATALSRCYAGGAGRNGLLLGFGGTDERRLAEAVRVLGSLLRRSARPAPLRAPRTP